MHTVRISVSSRPPRGHRHAHLAGARPPLIGLPFHCQAGAVYFDMCFGTDLTNGLTVVAN